MTEEYFYDNWYKECLKGGVLTIPDNLTELSGWKFHGCEDIRKVILPATGIDIEDEVLPKCIKYIETNPNFKEDYEREWEPTYLHIKSIVVPTGSRDSFVNLFWQNLQTYEGWFQDVTKHK